MPLNARLRRAREAAGLTQDQAAAAVGVSKATIQNWERARRKISDPAHVAAVVRAYGISADFIYGIIDELAPHQARDAGATSPGVEAASGPGSLEEARQLRGAKRLAAGAAEEAGRRRPQKGSRTGDQKGR